MPTTKSALVLSFRTFLLAIPVLVLLTLYGTTQAGNSPQSNPEAVPGAVTISSISTGFEHACAIRSDNTVTCWGAGKTNTGTEPNYGQAIDPSGTFTQISAGQWHTCGVQTNGTVD